MSTFRDYVSPHRARHLTHIQDLRGLVPRAERVRAEFFLEGIVPGFKNRKLIGRAGRTGRSILYTREDVKALMNALVVHAREVWIGRFPLTAAEVDVTFYVRTRAKDLDNCMNAVMDCLKDARVIVNDSMAHVRREGSDFLLVSSDAREGAYVKISGQETRLKSKKVRGQKK